MHYVIHVIRYETAGRSLFYICVINRLPLLRVEI